MSEWIMPEWEREILTALFEADPRRLRLPIISAYESGQEMHGDELFTVGVHKTLVRLRELKLLLTPAERDAQEKRVRELEEELDAHTEMLTDVWKRAIKMWQDETGRTDTWPDGAQHYAYLMGKITELEAENERLRLLEIELMEYKTIPGRVGRPTYLYEEAIDAAKRNAGGKHE